METISKLRQLSGLITKAIDETITILESSSHDASGKPVVGNPPEWPLFDKRRTLLAAAGLLTELVSDPSNRLLEVSSQYFEARALHIAADARIPDLLSTSGSRGLHVQDLSSKIGIESRKLCMSQYSAAT